MNIDDFGVLYRANQTLLTSLAILAGLGMVLLIASRLRRMTEHRATLLIANILTFVAAALATMVSASGMWKFFTDILGPSPLRIAFFAYIEIALFASALLARARLLREPEKGTTGIDGVAVWVLAALTASLSALDANSFREVCLRLVAPLVAAWMWERALAAERSERLGRTRTRIHWTITLERIFVWLRLAEAHGRDVSEVDRARRRARLGRARLNLYLLQNKRTAAWRLRRAHNKVIRQAMQAAEHIGLAEFPDAANERQAIQMYMATLYGFVDATSPDAVADLNAWRPTTPVPEPDGTSHGTAHVGPTGDVDVHRVPAIPGGTTPLAESALRRLNEPGLNADASEPDALTAATHDGSGDRGPRTDDSSPTDDPRSQNGTAAPGRPTSANQADPSPDGADGSDDETDTSEEDDSDDETAADVSAVAAMRRFWDRETARGRIPTGAELSRAAGVPPTTGLGRRMRRVWEADLPDQLTAAGATRK